MSSSLTTLVPVLSDPNYQVWSVAMKSFLMLQGQWHVLTRPCPRDITLDKNGVELESDKMPSQESIDENQGKIDEWDNDNQKAVGNIMLRLVSSDAIFARIFCPFSTQLHSTFLTPPFSLMPIFDMFIPLCFHAHEQTTRTQFDWYHQTPNNSSTGLPTSQNSPVVVPPHPDPAQEPPQPPPNAPTTQSSRLPGHGARVGVRPPHEGFWSLTGSLLLLQQDRPDRLPPCNEPHPLTLREMRRFQPEQGSVRVLPLPNKSR